MNQTNTPTHLPAQGAGHYAAVFMENGGRNPLSDVIYETPEQAEAAARQVIDLATASRNFHYAFGAIFVPLLVAVFMGFWGQVIQSAARDQGRGQIVAAVFGTIVVISFAVFVRNVLKKEFRDALRGK